ncbi:MAG: ferritin [Campylobacterota bacterium]|nr:ferritin [Campylobacterota bacterium]
MISKPIVEKLNKQLKKEFHSAYLYLGMSAWCQEHGYSGSANWFNLQFEEEQMHAKKIYQYILDQGGHIELLDIKAVKTNYTSLQSCFETSLAHEQSMTEAFNDLCDIAIKEKDHASYSFLQWFVNEQIEEEATVSDVISKLKMVGDGNGIFMIDNQLASRTVAGVVE